MLHDEYEFSFYILQILFIYSTFTLFIWMLTTCFGDAQMTIDAHLKYGEGYW